MATAGKSMAQDAVDHYSQWWAFLFLLLLSVITLFLPLHPSLTFKSTPIAMTPGGKDADTAASQKSTTTQPDYPKFIASCWCPAQFTGAHVTYTNAVCSSALNEMIRGRKISAAAVFRNLESEIIPINRPERPELLSPSDFLPTESNQTSDGMWESLVRKELEMRMEKHQKQRDTLHEGIRNLVGYKTALVLFLFAVCLRLPHAIWSLLSTCCGCVNVERTLDTVQTTMMMDARSQNEIREDIAASIKSPSRKAGLLYLLMKLLMVVVLCAECVVVGYNLLPETTRLENDLVKVDTMGRAIRSIMAQSSGQRSAQTPAKTKTDKEDFQETGINAEVFLCDFKIRQMQNLRNFIVQCVFRKVPEGESVEEGGSQGGKGDKVALHQTASGSEEQALLLYKALFSMVLALLGLLAVFNVASLGTWTAKLLLGVCQPSMALRNDASMDLVLLVSMAWYNASPLVAMEIAKSAPGGRDKLMPKAADEADASC